MIGPGRDHEHDDDVCGARFREGRRVGLEMKSRDLLSLGEVALSFLYFVLAYRCPGSGGFAIDGLERVLGRSRQF